MTDLNDDIARIAALRGKPVDNYVAEAARITREERRVYAGEIADVFRMRDNMKAEMASFDRLPGRSRMVLSEMPLCPSAIKYSLLLQRVRDETFLIQALRDSLPSILRNWVLDHFGPMHPSTRKLA